MDTAADACVTLNKIINDTVSLIGNIIAILFYIAFSPFICILLLLYPSVYPEQEDEVELIQRRNRYS